MRKFTALTFGGALFAGTVMPAAADSCYDLWYERNLIYAQHGYCFTTSLGQHVFADYDCWTNNPKLERWEQRRVAEIKAEERRLRCRVNQ